jgi:hypothetical protein
MRNEKDEKRGQRSIRTVLLDSGLFRASARAEAAFKPQLSNGLISPVAVAEGAAAVDGVAQCCEFFEVVRLVDESGPVGGRSAVVDSVASATPVRRSGVEGSSFLR